MNRTKVQILGLVNNVPGLLPLYRWIRATCRLLQASFFNNILRQISLFRLPKKCFSGVRDLDENKVTGKIILRNQGAPHVSPKSIMAVSGLRQHEQQPWPIFWSYYRTARLHGTSLCLLNERNELCLESAYGTRYWSSDPAYYTSISKTNVRLKGNWTSLISNWVPTHLPTNYAHWMFDALPRLAVLSELPSDTQILVPQGLLPYQIDTLKILGLEGRYRTTSEKAITIENYYFSAPTSMIVCYSPYAVQFLRKSFLHSKAQAGKTPKRFFLRRTGKIRNITNEQEVLTFFQNLGWSIVDAGALSFPQQVQYFSQAEAICGIHGAAFTNCVWCKPGCTIIEIFAANYLNGCFEWLSQCVNAQYHSLIFPGDDLLSARIDLKEIEAKLSSANLI